MSLAEFVNLIVFFFVVPWPDPRFGVVDQHEVVRKVGLTIWLIWHVLHVAVHIISCDSYTLGLIPVGC